MAEGDRVRVVRVPGMPRPKSYFVRVSAEEAARLQGLMVELGAVNVQDVFRLRTLYMDSGGVSPVEWQELKAALFELKRMLSGVAVNWNQMARAANAGVPPTAEQADATLGWLREMAGPGGRLDQVLDEIAPMGRVR